MDSSILYLFGVTSAVVLGILAVLFLLFTAYLIYQDRKFRHIPGPPVDNFYLGHIPTMSSSMGKGMYTGYRFAEWAEEYGPLFKIRLLHWHMLIPSSASLLKEFLTKSKYPKDKVGYSGLFGLFGKRFMGHGLITNTNHPQWYQRRSAVNPAFHKRNLAQMIGKFNEVADDFITKLGEHTDGSSILLAEYLNRATMAGLCKAGFGMHLNVIQDKDDAFPSAVRRGMGGASSKSRDPFVNIYPHLGRYRRMMREACDVMRGYGLQCLKQRSEMVSRGEAAPFDIISGMLNMINKVPKLEVDDALDEFVTVFVAGQETTANTMSFFINIAGSRPDVLKKLQEEADRVLGDKSEATWEDINKLEYLTQCIKETLRLYPVAPGTMRCLTEDAEIDGYKIPKGATIFACFFLPQRNEKYFDNPLEFNPDRWTPDYRPPLYTYSPFSMGSRTCVGQHFAMIEVKLFMARFFQNFDFILDPHQDFSIKESITLRPRGGCKMTISPRGRKYSRPLQT